MNEFGDPENQGYATDFAELRLMARYLIDRRQLLRDLLEGEMPATFQEGYVSIAGAIGDRRLTPHLLRILRRSEDVSEVAQTINVLGRLGDSTVVPALEGYALSANDEISTVAVLAIEALGESEAERILRLVEGIVAGTESSLAAHVDFARLHLRDGADALDAELLRVAADENAPKVNRLAAIERLSGTTNPETIRLLASLLDDPTYERVNVDGFYTDDVVYTIREAAYLALNDRRIIALVQVLGEDILDRFESFQMYTMPSWWDTFEIDPEIPDDER
jgi:HEAT repeat protein